MSKETKDLRQLTRTVLRKNPTDVVIKSKDGKSAVKFDKMQVTPSFAQIVEQMFGSKQAYDVVEVWSPENDKNVGKKTPRKKRTTKKKTSPKEK